MTTTPYDEWRRHRSCERKRGWSTEQLANNFAVLLGWAHPEAPPQHPYLCEWCTEWHLTSKPDPERTTNMITKFAQCHYLRPRAGEQCTGEAVVTHPDEGVLLCQRHLAASIQLVNDRLAQARAKKKAATA